MATISELETWPTVSGGSSDLPLQYIKYDIRHTTHDTRHPTRDSRLATRDTRHATRDTRHATHDTRHMQHITYKIYNNHLAVATFLFRFRRVGYRKSWMLVTILTTLTLLNLSCYHNSPICTPPKTHIYSSKKASSTQTFNLSLIVLRLILYPASLAKIFDVAAFPNVTLPSFILLNLRLNLQTSALVVSRISTILSH